MKTFGLTSLALEWPEDLTPMIRAFLASGTLADHRWLWGGDGRITPATWRCWPTTPPPGRWT